MKPYGTQALRHRVEAEDRRAIRGKAKKRARQDAAREAQRQYEDEPELDTARMGAGIDP